MLLLILEMLFLVPAVGYTTMFAIVIATPHNIVGEKVGGVVALWIAVAVLHYIRTTG